MELTKTMTPVQLPTISQADIDKAIEEGLPTIARIWLRPIRPQFGAVVCAWNRPLSEITTRDAMAIGIFTGYCCLSGMIAARILANIVR